MTKEQLGEFVKQQRLLQNVTQSELAEKIGFRRQAIIEIENCQSDYGISVILRVLNALGYKLVPTVTSTELPKYKPNTVLHFSKIESATEKDDPYLQEKKRLSIFAQSKRKLKIKTT